VDRVVADEDTDPLPALGTTRSLVSEPKCLEPYELPKHLGSAVSVALTFPYRLRFRGPADLGEKPFR
jgi:hypothetical protein